MGEVGAGPDSEVDEFSLRFPDLIVLLSISGGQSALE
jgi:hypothetical protein